MTKTIAFIVTSEMTATHFLTPLVLELQEHGWHVDVLAGDDGGLIQWGGSVGVQAHPMPYLRNPSPLKDFYALIKTILHLKQSKPDLVVAATPKASLLGMMAATACRIPHRIYLAWGLRLDTTVGPRRTVYALLERITTQLSSQCLANSDSLAKRMVSLGLARSDKIQVPGKGSSHGVDLDYYSSDPTLTVDPATEGFLQETPASLTVLFVGRLNPDKGIETLLSAIARCIRDETPIRLLIVGPREGWDSESIPLEVQHVTHLTGQQQDVRPYYQVSDVLCLPSLREGFPNVVLEAAAMSIPSIVSDATGCIDSVIHQETGLVFPVRDSTMLAGHLQHLSALPSECKELGANARRWVEENYSARRVIALYEEAFSTEISREGAK